MSLAIEMTVRGVLLAGKWQTEAQLPPEGAQNPRILDSWRNALIESLVNNTDAAHYQQHHNGAVRYFQAKDNDTLIGMGAVVVFLREGGFYDSQQLKSYNDDQQRNGVISQNFSHTGRLHLQGMTNKRNVEIGLQWFPTSTPKHPRGDGSLAEPTFGDPNNNGIDPTVFGYFQMIFERARTHYLASNYEQAGQLLAWINSVFPKIPSDSANLEKIMPFCKSAVALKNNLGLKLDYYGHTFDHVPALSYDYYKGQLQSLLKSLEEIEKKYDSYLSASRKDEERHSDYVAALTETETLCKALSEERSRTQVLIKVTVSDINATETAVEAAKATLIEKIRDLSEKIQEFFSLPNAEQLAGIMLNLSFMPEKTFGQVAMVSSQALTAGSDISHSLSKVTMDDGTEIDKRFVINRLDTVGGDVANLDAAYTVSQRFIQKDAGIYRVLQKAEQFDELCSKFYTSSPKAREAQTSMDEFVRKIKYRNGKIDEYNALWARLGDLQGQLAKINADKDSKAIVLARSEDPGLPHRVAAFTNLYNRVRDTTLKYLYLMSRAHSFWALEPYDLTTVCKLIDPDSIDHATLLSAKTTIEGDCALKIEKCMSELRQAAMPDAGADLKKATGIKVTFTKETDPKFIDSLQKKGIARFELPTTDPSFGGKANVRVTRVRAWIHGMKTDNNIIHEVLITHTGPETIITTENEPIEFSHDPITVPFRYDASKGLENPIAIFEGSEGPHDGVILEDGFAPIGPFTTWRLAILKDNNPKGLVLTGIEKVVMEFHIIAQSLKKDTIDPPESSTPRH